MQEAAAWFLVAAATGNEDSDTNIRLMIAEMNTAEIEAAIERAEIIAAELGIEVNLVFEPDAPPAPSGKSKS